MSTDSLYFSVVSLLSDNLSAPTTVNYTSVHLPMTQPPQLSVFLQTLPTWTIGRRPAVCDWTHPRQWLCGRAPVTAGGQDHHQKCAATIICRNNCQFSAQPRCYHGQSTVTWRTCCGYHQLRQLRPVARSLSTDAAKTLVHAFVSNRLDYCNALLYGMSEGLLHYLQSAQNVTVRLVTGARRRDHITPNLRQLHWLPVRKRVQFKVAVLVFQGLSGNALTYLADNC